MIKQTDNHPVAITCLMSINYLQCRPVLKGTKFFTNCSSSIHFKFISSHLKTDEEFNRLAEHSHIYIILRTYVDCITPVDWKMQLSIEKPSKCLSMIFKHFSQEVGNAIPL